MRRKLSESWWRWASLAAVTATAAMLVVSAVEAENRGKRKSPAAAGESAQQADLGDPTVQLVRDPDVQQELALKPPQVEAVDASYAKIERRLWRLRDVATGPGAQEKARLLASMADELPSILEPAQMERLQQLVVRGRGWPGIAVDPAATRLKLSPEQLKGIAKVTADARSQAEQVTASADGPAAREAALAKLRTNEGASIVKLLSSEQQQMLSGLVGEPYDLTDVQPLSFAAPELAQTDAWLNTRPLKLADMRGKVVALHFWAFSCINCIHNLPHYAKWHDTLASQGLVVLGMHTPETQSERSLTNLRSEVDKLRIRYPVAMDHEGANWNAWANSVWPSVYLVDKRGRVRYWWYGELNWQGAQGEAFMRQKIEQLLAE